MNTRKEIVDNGYSPRDMKDKFIHEKDLKIKISEVFNDFFELHSLINREKLNISLLENLENKLKEMV